MTDKETSYIKQTRIKPHEPKRKLIRYEVPKERYTKRRVSIQPTWRFKNAESNHE